jgi:hypothetical protein
MLEILKARIESFAQHNSGYANVTIIVFKASLWRRLSVGASNELDATSLGNMASLWPDLDAQDAVRRVREKGGS